MLEEYITPEFALHMVNVLHITGDLYLLGGVGRAYLTSFNRLDRIQRELDSGIINRETASNLEVDGFPIFAKEFYKSWFKRYLPIQVGAFTILLGYKPLDALLEKLF